MAGNLNRMHFDNSAGTFHCLLISVLLLSSCGGRGGEQVEPAGAAELPQFVSSQGSPAPLPTATADELLQARSEFTSLAAPEGVDADVWQQLGDALLDALESRSTSKLPDEGRNEIDDLTWVDNGGGDFNLEWTFRNAGDYDNNGEVNVSDLSAIGVHFGKNDTGSDWANAQTADGDGNGEINIADVSPIGINFGSQVLGYNVYASDFEDGPWLKQGSIALDDAGTVYPRMFSYAYGAQEHAFVTVSPFDASGMDSIVNSGGTTARFIPGNTTEQSSQAIDAGGGQLTGSGELAGITVDIPAGALDRTETITLGSNDGVVIPVVGEWGGQIIDISGDDPILFEESIAITAPFSGDPADVPVPYYIRSDGQMEACLVTDMDRDNGTFSFVTDHTSYYTWFIARINGVGGDYSAPGFSPSVYGFQIQNFGSDYNGKGECLGMTAFSQWYYRYASPKPAFFPRFLNQIGTNHDGTPINGQDIIATRSFNSVAIAQARYIGKPLPGPHSDQVIRIKHAILSTNAPTNIGLYGSGGGHAVLAYGYTDNKLLIYDPNHPNQANHFDLTEDGFTYPLDGRFSDLYHMGIGSFTRENFGLILVNAESGFTGNEDALIHKLNFGSSDIVTEQEIMLSGEVSSSELLVERIRVLTGFSSHEAPVDLLTGEFSILLPIRNGDNYLTFTTLGRDGSNNWVNTPNNFSARRGLYLIGDNEEEPGTLEATLTWDQDGFFGLEVTDPDGNVATGVNFFHEGIQHWLPESGLIYGDYSNGGPIHFGQSPPQDMPLKGEYKFRVLNNSDPFNELDTNWTLSISADGAPAEVFNGTLSIGTGNEVYPDDFGPFWSDYITITY